MLGCDGCSAMSDNFTRLLFHFGLTALAMGLGLYVRGRRARKKRVRGGGRPPH